MAQAKAPEKKTDWLVPTAVVLGGAGIAVGLYFYTKKPSGVDPGDTIRARFVFDYLGSGGSYLLLVRFGTYRVILGVDWFDPVGGLDRFTRTVNLPGPDSYQFDLSCRIPAGTSAGTYDAEGSVLSPDMSPGLDWIIRHFTKQAINVRKE